MVLKYKSKPGLKTSLKFINLLPLSIKFFFYILYANLLRWKYITIVYKASLFLLFLYIHYMIYTYKKYIEYMYTSF